MREWQSQSHVRWYCKYHLVLVPKYRERQFYGDLRRDIGKTQAQGSDALVQEIGEQAVTIMNQGSVVLLPR